jgi:two-component sensor histidine kinase/Tfp pilus assembly protein PilF
MDNALSLDYNTWPRLIIVCFVCIFSFQPALQAQLDNILIDSLKSVINSRSDTNQVNAYYELGRHYFNNNNPEEGYPLMLEALPLALKNKMHYRSGTIYEFMGLYHDMLGNLEEAIETYELARFEHQQVPNNGESLNILDLNIGVAYYFAGDLSNALKFYLKAYQDAKAHGYRYNFSRVVNNIAVIYRRNEEYDSALQYYRESLSIKSADNDSSGMASTLQNMGLCYSYKDQADSSMNYLQQAKQIYEQVGDYEEVPLVNLQIADAHYRMDQYPEALKKLEEIRYNGYAGLPLSNELNAHVTLGALYNINNAPTQALKILDQALAAFGKSEYTDAIMEIHRERAKTLHVLGRSAEAYDELMKANELKEAIDSELQQKESVKQQTKFETIQKEAEIIRLGLADDLNKARLSQQRIGLLATIGALGLLGFFSYRLRQKNQRIQKQDAEKEVLLKEIHHRVKNNLQVISSLLGLQGLSIKDAKAKAAIQEGRSRVHSMSLIHQRLYKKDNLTGIEMKPYLEKLTADLIATYNYKDIEIQPVIDSEDITLDVETVVPIGLIINELVTNSVKYAFEGRDTGIVHIAMFEDNGLLHLVVSDNGIGLDTDQLKAKEDSYGHSLIRAFRDKLNAEIKVENQDGTKIELIIKSYKTAK